MSKWKSRERKSGKGGPKKATVQTRNARYEVVDGHEIKIASPAVGRDRALPYLKKSKKFPSLCASEPLDPTAAPLWGAKTGVFNARAAFSRETCLAHLNAT